MEDNGYNEYDEVITGNEPEQQEGPVNEYDDVVDGMLGDQKNVVKETIKLASTKDPLRSKDVFNISKKNNLPSNIVDKNLDQFKAKEKEDSFQYDELLKINPGLSKWLENPDHAAIAQKEIEPLKRVERAAFKIRKNKKDERFTKQLDSALYTGWNQLNTSAQFVMSAYGVGNNKDIAQNISSNAKRAQELKGQKPEFSKEFDKEMASDVKDIDEAFEQFKGSYEELRKGNIIDALTDFAAGGAKTVGETLELVGSAVIRPKGLVYSSTESLANSFPSIITGFAGMKAGAIAGSVVPVKGTAIGGAIGFGVGTFAGSVLTEIGGAISEDLAERGVDLTDPIAVEKMLNNKEYMQTVIERAQRKGIGTAAVDGIFNMFAGKALAGVKKAAKETGKAVGKTALVKAGTKDVIADMAGEGIGEFVGQVAKEKSLKGVSIGQAIQEGTTSLGSSINDVAIGAASKIRQEFIDDPIKSAEDVVNDAQNAIESIQEIQAVNDLSIAIKEAKNTSEAQDAIRNLVESANDEGESSSVYFQVDDFNNFWNSKGESPLAKAYEISDEVGKSYAEASALGSDIEIPIGDYAETIAKTDDADGLLNSVKTRSDGMNLNQANKTMNELPSVMKQLSEQVAKLQDDEFIQSAKEVKSRVKDQLKLAGMNDKDAELQANLYEGRIKTRAILRGKDPLELFREQNLEIRKTGQQVVRDNTTYDEILKNKKLKEENNKKAGIKELKVEQLQGEALTLAEQAIDTEVEQMIYEISQSEKGNKIFTEAETGGAPIVDMQQSTFPKWYREVQAKNKQSFGKTALSKKGAVYKRIRTVAIERLKNGYENIHSGQVEPDQTFKALLGIQEDKASDFDLFQSAYHGTKEDFKTFDFDKAENTRHGYGVYFAANKAIADMYRKMRVARSPQKVGDRKSMDQVKDTEGTVKEVDLNVENLPILDLDKKISEQGDIIKEIAKSYKGVKTGNELYKAVSKELGGDKEASQFLDSKGIYGATLVTPDKFIKETFGDSERYFIAYSDKLINKDNNNEGRETGQRENELAIPEITTELEGKPKGIKHNQEARQVAREYLKEAGIEERQQSEYVKVNVQRAKRISKAFEEMKHDPENQEVKEAYQAMIDETLAQYQSIKNTGLKIEMITADMENPYPNGSQDMFKDLDNGHLWFFPTEQGFGSSDQVQDNPLLQQTDESIDGYQLAANDLFRIVHDYFGHYKEGSSFGPRGEENAWQSHVRMYSPKAARAMTTETRGQNSWVNYGPKGKENRENPANTTFADQKVGLLPEWVLIEGQSSDADKAVPGEKTKEEIKDLFVTHNLSERNLKHALKVGGLAVPSLAVTKKGKSLENFGEISLIARPDMLETKGAKTFNADVYSPRYPSIDYTIPKAGRKKYEDIVGSINEEIFNDSTDYNKIEGSGLRALQEDKALMYAFLESKGIDPIVAYESIEPEKVEAYREAGFEKFFGGQGMLDAQNKEFVKLVKEFHINELGNKVDQEDISDIQEALDDPRGHYLDRVLYSVKEDMGLINDTQEIDKRETETNIKKQIFDDPTLTEEFDQYASDVYDTLDIKEKVFKDTNPNTGAIRYIPHTLDNVVKLMKKSLRDGENFNYGVGSIRSKVAKQFKSIEEMGKDRDKVVSKEEFEAIKEEIDREFGDLFDKVQAEVKHYDGWGSLDLFSEHLKEVAETNINSLDQYYNLSDETKQEVVDFLDKLKNMETEYFESKVQRAVDIDEFQAAIIPENTSDETKKILKGLGLDIVEYNDDNRQEVTENYTDSQAEKILFQGGKQDPKGQISVGKDFFRIDLLAKADPSTFLHETGHLFLEEMREDYNFIVAQGSNRTEVQQKFMEDVSAILTHLGVESFNAIETKHHELFARTFESYLMEGKAPTKELQTAFSRFRAWLITVYREIKNLNAPLTDEVRGLMDRMLATEDEINAAIKEQGIKSLITKEMESKVDKNKLKTYQELRDLFSKEAKDKMSINLAKSWKKEQELFTSQKGKEIKAQAEEELLSDGVYKALDIFKNGTIDGEPIRMNKGDLVNLFGAGIVKKLPSTMYTTNGGMLPSVVASIMGFSDVGKMVNGIAEAPPLSKAVKAISEDRMRQENQDLLLTDDRIEGLAKRFIHSDKRSELLKMELSLLSDIEQANLKEGTRKTVRRIPSNEKIKKEANTILSAMQMKKIRPYLYQRAEVREARKVEEFISKGQWAEAFDAKQRELLSHELYRSASDIKEKQNKQLKKFKKLNQADTKLSKTRDMTFINAARAILSKFDLASKPEVVMANLDMIRKYDPDVHAMVTSIIESVDIENQSYKELTLEQFTEINDIFDTLWDLSKTSKQMDIDGKKVDIQKVVEQMNESASRFIKEVPKRKYEKKKDKFTKIKEEIMSQVSKMRRLEHWIELMDMGDIGGIFRKAIFTPLSEATDRYFEDRDIYTKKMIDASERLKEKVPGIEDPKAIQSDELGYEFENVGEIIGALIHTGNDSNFKKLLIGREWGTLNDDKTLNTAKWDKFIQRMYAEGIISDDHMDFVQEIWDITEEIKPMVQKAHKEVYGHYFSEITTNEITMPSGKKYKGGYAPAKVDYDVVPDAGKRDTLQDIVEGSPSFSLPGAGGNGFGKSRVENYNKALNLNIDLITRHIDEVIRFAHVKPAVTSAAKLVNSNSFKEMMNKIDPSLIDNMIIPAIIRADKNKTTDVPTTRMGLAMKIGGSIRKNVSAALFFGHIRNTVEQLGNMAVAISKDGIDAKDLAHGAMSLLKDRKKTREAIYEKSTFMRKKVNMEIFDNNKRINNLFKEQNKILTMRDFAQDNAYITQNALQTFQDEVIWIGAYDRAVASGKSESDSVRLADSIIRTTQNGNRPLDISNLEGNPMLKMIQMFMGFFNNMANVNATNMQKIYYSDLSAKEKTGKALYAYLTGYASIAIVSAALRKVAAGGLDEDEDDMYMDDLYDVFIASQAELFLGMLPLIGPAIQAGMNRGNEKFYDDKIGASPVLEAVASVADYAIPDFGSDKDITERVKSRELLTVISVVTGFPVAPLSKPFRYVMAVESGEAQPTGPIDYTRGLVTGKKGVK